eukprot:71910_1
MSNIKLETKTYDVILLGTGLVQSIVASACARAGKTVLHIDRNEFYGGRNATFNLGEFQKWLQSENDVEGSTHDPEHAESNLAAWKEIAEDIDDKYVYLPISERCQDFECFDQKSELQKDDFNEEKRDECDSNSPSEEKSPRTDNKPNAIPNNQTIIEQKEDSITDQTSSGNQETVTSNSSSTSQQGASLNTESSNSPSSPQVGIPSNTEPTTSLPEATTSHPEATTSQPEATTSQPEATTSQPEATTSQPEATASQPEATTSQPEATASQPEATTSQPGILSVSQLFDKLLDS